MQGTRIPRLGENQPKRLSILPMRFVNKFDLVEAQSCSPAQLYARRHPLDFVTQATPVVRLQFGVLDPLLAPVLVQTADVVLALLEVNKFVSNAFLDKDTPGMLLNNGCLILKGETCQ